MTDLVQKLVGALEGTTRELESVLSAINDDRIPHDGDEFHERLQAARAALSEAKAGGWQPIETAPKDGTEVLCWREDCGQFIACYTSMDAMPLTQDEIDATDEETLFAKDWFTQWPQSIRLDGSETPTKWQPLPAPPAQKDNT